MTREQAITIIRQEYLCVDRDCNIEKNCGKCDLAMPSKEPILEAYKMAIEALEQEPCDDCVSRQAVFEIIRDFEYKNSHEEMLINSRIKQLPSVTPTEKVGQWKPYDGSWYECSECGAIREAVGYFENFCPNCGAKMQEVEE